jgi:hypothetical protein
LDNELLATNASIQTLSESLKDALFGREPNEERDQLLAQWKEIQSAREKLEKELDSFKDCDPNVLKERGSGN